MIDGDPDDLRSHIRDVPDFPQPGVLFRDITPLLADAAALRRAITGLADALRASGGPPDRVAGIEARGFVVAAPLALELGVGFVPVRKPGKLPAETVREDYDLEYGTDALEVHADATTVLLQACEWPEEIDLNRAKEAMERAEHRLEQQRNTQAVTRSKIALSRALMRIKVKTTSVN